MPHEGGSSFNHDNKPIDHELYHYNEEIHTKPELVKEFELSYDVLKKEISKAN